MINNKELHLSDEELKKAGLKVTTPRTKIFNILENSDQKHLTAEEIYNILNENNQNVSLATVYRVLSQFEVADLVTKHLFEGDQAVFELNKDEHHDHIICTECGKVSEFYDETIEKKQEEIAKKFGFKITSHSLYIFGTCNKCQKK